ncbi:MAG: ATP-binding protein [Nanoarchaeota archaeon]
MYIEREIKSKFEKIQSVYSVVTLVGARQSGKTTFLKEHLIQKKSKYLLFDDPDIRSLFEEDIKKFETQFIEGNDISILDEVQYCKDAGRNLKYLADKGHKLWITASSEAILSKEVLSYLVGRVSILKLYPFSLKEFLKSKNQKEATEKVMQRNISEHISYGGYPKVVITDDIELKKTILQDLYSTMVLKDIAKTFSIQDSNELEKLIKYLSLNIGEIIAYENISKNLGISFQSLKKYLDAMEKSYLLVRIQPFYNNKLKEITKQQKIYFIDTGLRNIISKDSLTEVSGHLFENYVASELIKQGFTPKYWRTKSGAEVDFVIEKDSEIIPIEVKLNASPEKIETGMRSFIEEYKPKKAFVFSHNGQSGKSKVNGCEIIFTNIFDLESHLKNL